MGVKIVIDRGKCGATGNCVYWAPKTFDQDDQGLAIVIDPAGDSIDLIRQAAQNCPTGAILLVEDDDALVEDDDATEKK